ncbi:MAG: hypothetical protein ACI8WB_005752 [Phenylobacterium sp.]|jgi:hypothetical protein
MDNVYHSSPIQGLSEISAQSEGTHGNHWIYAAYNKVISGLFLAKPYTSEFICAKRMRDGKVILTERFAGAFDLSYANKQGAIYVLPAASFDHGITDFTGECVTTKSVKPLSEIAIDDVKAYLLDLQTQGELVIHYYPEREADIPADDEDLVIDTAVWAQAYGDSAVEKLAQYHPHLKDAAVRAIEDNTYGDVKAVGLIRAFD